ncbi:MAG: hypothetical protein U1D55_06705 [Phycisphaerae bacterium]
MSTMTKVFVVLTAVFAIAVSVLAISATAQWDNWKRLAQDYESARESEFTQRAQMAATMEASLALRDLTIESRAREVADLQGKLQTATDDKAKALADLAQAKNEALAFDAGRTKLQELLDVTSAERNALQKQNQTLLEQNIDIQTRNARLNSRVLELTTSVAILTDDVRNTKERLAACEQTAGGRAPAITQAETPIGAVAVTPMTKGVIRGEVVSVDGGYASINIGEGAGVTNGMTFTVFRDGSGYLGDLIVEKVRPKDSGGRLATVQGDIRRGDQVIFGLEN